MQRHVLRFGSENILNSIPRPKSFPANDWASFTQKQSRADSSQSADEYSDPSIVYDSDDDEEDECVVEDFDLPDDFTIPFLSSKQDQIMADSQLQLQSQELGNHIPVGAIEEKQGQKIVERRFLLGDWLFNLSFIYPTITETLFQSFSLLDLYLSHREVEFDKLQLIACTCLWICSKVDFCTVASLEPLIKNCHNKYSRKDFVQAETEILTGVNYGLRTASVSAIIRQYLEILKGGDQLNALSFFIAESSLMFICFSSFSRSAIALASTLIACATINVSTDPIMKFIKESNISEVKKCTQMLLHYSRGTLKKRELGLHRKYTQRGGRKETLEALKNGADLVQSLGCIFRVAQL